MVKELVARMTAEAFAEEPPLVIGTGLFVLLSPRVNVFDWVYPIVVVIMVIIDCIAHLDI